MPVWPPEPAVEPVTAQLGGGVPTSNGSSLSGNHIYGGNGVPASTLGINGDIYFRHDTPGTANQRVYVKNAGSWTGVV
jgi:hypothetical protein